MSIKYENRTATDILATNIYHDAVGFGLRAASWIDYAARTNEFTAVYYACIDCRLSIEHLLYEVIVVSAEPQMTEESYQICLKSGTKLEKVLARMAPEYDALVDFTLVLRNLNPSIPLINKWNIKDLKKDWGCLSSYLHWCGSASETSHNAQWQLDTLQKVASIIIPYWERLGAGKTGIVKPDSMSPNTKKIWELFRNRQLDANSAFVELQRLGP